MMWLVYGIRFGSIVISGNSNLQSAKNSNQPTDTNTAVVQQEPASQSIQGASTD
jgi:hypothetical protein